jgi:hypothetical protein
METDVSREISALKSLGSWPELERLQQILVESRRQRLRRNIFRLTQWDLRTEGLHSRMIAWLLDPQEWHGLGDRFASRFLGALLGGCDAAERPPATVVRVETEASTGEGPIDISLETRSEGLLGVIGIENKIDSPEVDGQLWRYGVGLVRKFPDARVFVALLTPDHREPNKAPACGFASIGYSDVASWLEDAIHDAQVDDSSTPLGLDIAQQYLDVVRGDVMREANSEVKAICEALYKQHREAWQVIRRRLPSERDESLRQLGSKVCERFAAKFGGDWHFSVRHGKYARVYRDDWCALGTRTEEEPVVGWDGGDFLSWNYAAAHLRFYLTEIPDDETSNEYGYKIGLKIDIRGLSREDHLPRRIIAALEREDLRVFTRDQWTTSIKSASKLPSIVKGPDQVLDWAVAHAKRAIDALNSAFTAEPGANV